MKHSILGLTVLSALSVIAHAQQASVDDEIEHIVVSASPFAQKLSDTPNSVFVASQKNIG